MMSSCPSIVHHLIDGRAGPSTSSSATSCTWSDQRGSEIGPAHDGCREPCPRTVIDKSTEVSGVLRASRNRRRIADEEGGATVARRFEDDAGR